MLSINRYTFLCIFLFFFSLHLIAQDDQVYSNLEDLSEGLDIQMDFSELFEERASLRDHPINLNSNHIDRLQQLLLLSSNQLENLKTYIQENQSLVTIYELQLIEGFSKETIEMLMPYVIIKPIEKFFIPSLNQIYKYSRHESLIRMKWRFPESLDSISQSYLGNNSYYYFRYKFSYSRLLQWGFTLEKDAGELFLGKSPAPSRFGNSSSPQTIGFDFSSAHLIIRDIGIIKQFVLGDYHILLGQGLTIWTGFSFGKSNNATNRKRYNNFIKASTSSNENRFLRGGAIHLGTENWSLLFFYSKNQQDANIKLDESGKEYVSSLIQTGLHRNINELEKKDALTILLYGGHFKLQLKYFSIGVTATSTHFTIPIKPNTSPNQLFEFDGKHLNNYGADYGLKLWKAHIYGETAISSGGGYSFINGIEMHINSRFEISVQMRNYAKNYHNFFASPDAENNKPSNERGLYIGTKLLLSRGLILQAYADYFSFPWVKFQQDAPSHGLEYRVYLVYEINPNTKMHLKLKYKEKEINFSTTQDGKTNFLKAQTKYSWQFQFNYRISHHIELKNRIEMTHFQIVSNKTDIGFLIYQDLSYQSSNQNFTYHARITLYNTSSFKSAIYAYENDLLYTFNVPVFSGQGLRFYNLISLKLNNRIKLWFKVGLSLSDTLEKENYTIAHNDMKTEVKLLIRIKI